MQSTLRVDEMDGREFIRQSALTFWNNRFPPYRPVTNKEKRSRRHVQEANTSSTSSPTPGPPPENALPREPTRPQIVQHFIMNLPDSALTFLDAFWGLFTPLADEPGFQAVLEVAGLPLVHVYCFTKELDPVEAERDICEVGGLNLHGDEVMDADVM